ncbi:reverse transcriptase domain-containing protein [Tanacetum coccineum]
MYIRREASKEGSGVGLIQINPKDKEYSHTVRLNFHASKDDMECEAFLAGLAAAAGRQMKDLHMFVNSKLLVDQVEGNREKRANMYREEVMDATAPFHRILELRSVGRNQDQAIDRSSRQAPRGEKEPAKKATLGKPNFAWEDHSGSN